MRVEQVILNGPGRLLTITWADAVERAATAPVRSAQLGWGRQTISAAHATVTVTATRIPVPRLMCALAFLCRPRYRSVLA
jgi:hypothetical protein